MKALYLDPERDDENAAFVLSDIIAVSASY